MLRPMEWLVRVSIWACVLFWAAGSGLLLTGRKPDLARWFWTAGVLVFAVHVASSFAAFYEWSHRVALDETARQTAEVVGVKSGFGLWLNYAFGLIWGADVVFWWAWGHHGYEARPRWIGAILHGFLVFLVFNGAVVFVPGPMRWLGVALFVGLAALWGRARIWPPGASGENGRT